MGRRFSTLFVPTSRVPRGCAASQSSGSRVVGWISVLLNLVFVVPAFATEIAVGDPESARKAVRDAKPGDVVVLASGEWEDVDLRLDGDGSETMPITIRAETPGKTILTGASRVRIGGSHLVVSGLWLRNLSGAGADLLEFRIDSKRRANHCRVTECAFTEDPDFSATERENRWIGLYGAANRIDHCALLGKKNQGAALVVWLGEHDTGSHRIVSNYFGERPRLGKNGGETIRVGDSKTSMVRADCLIEGNVFFRCDGETECISNKSCGNRYRGNWFVETQGTLTLRHGNDCIVEGNVFDGRSRPQTGGIRVIGERHRVVGNYLAGLEGDGFRSAICLVNGIPDSPENGYLQVINTRIEDNVVLDCKESILIGYSDVDEATLPPKGTLFAGNRVVARSGRLAVRVETVGEETQWRGNRVEGAVEGMGEVPGVRAEDAKSIEMPSPLDPATFGTSWSRKSP
jgi:poly(beta-D-mannuronate) lyase